MTLVELVVAVLKILVVIGFLMNAAALATWAERRQSAMVQDRVGPNRAVVNVPSLIIRAIVLLPPTVLGMLSIFSTWGLWEARTDLAGAASVYDQASLARLAAVVRGSYGTLALSLELAVLVGWMSLALLSGKVRRSSAQNGLEQAVAKVHPRSYFFAGLALHLAVLVLARAVPFALAPKAAVAASWLLALVLFAAGLYTSGRIPEGKFPLRLAGTLHALADAMKMVWKEDFVPKNADRLLHALAPILAMFPALVTFAVIPFGEPLCLRDVGPKGWDFGDLSAVAERVPQGFACEGGHTVGLQVADLNVGILYLFAMAGTGIVGAAIAGWASDNKFALLGGLRAASQMVSYEVAMGLSIVGLFLIYGTVRLGPMVEWQQHNAWGIFVQPFAFFLFLAALNAELKRVPFDQPEGESEIVAGYFLEYSGMKWGMFMTGEYAELVTSSALLATLFFGGYSMPFLHEDGIRIAFGESVLFFQPLGHGLVVLLSALIFFGKTAFVVFIQIFFRWTLPRFRYDQLMKLGWTKLLPLAIANLFVTGIVVLAVGSAGPTLTATLDVLADVTQALVALGILAGLVAFIVLVVEPVERKGFLRSTATRFAAARGGTKAAPQQA